MIDVDAELTIQIRVENYEQVVKKDKGRFLGTVAIVPAVNSFVKKKVDETIEDEVKKNLEQTLPEKLAEELTKGLLEQGVQATVDVSVTS